MTREPTCGLASRFWRRTKPMKSVCFRRFRAGSATSNSSSDLSFAFRGRYLGDTVQRGGQCNLDHQLLDVEVGSNERLSKTIHYVRTVGSNRLFYHLVE